MSPTAIYISPNDTTSAPVAAAVPVKGPALAIGSLTTAQDGKYQSLITHLEETRKVERHMLDRLLDQGPFTFTLLDANVVLNTSNN